MKRFIINGEEYVEQSKFDIIVEIILSIGFAIFPIALILGWLIPAILG